MLNPLLHTSSSAPTSPALSRSARGAAVGKGSEGASPVHHATTTILATLAGGAAGHHHAGARARDASPAGAASARRLSRVVKCRTLDFTEFPEGMREYNAFVPATQQRLVLGRDAVSIKMAVRESRSQPGSPIPRIQVQDFGGASSSSAGPRFRVQAGRTKSSEVRW